MSINAPDRSIPGGDDPDRTGPGGRSKEERERFRGIIRTYYREAGRSFPWRETDDPFRILVSEIMLQQTQTGRVREKYGPFIERFPGFRQLAAASLEEVYPLWQGLGYNRRARSLLEIARIVTDRFGGSLPATLEDLTAMPGIGRNTACAVIVFSWNRPLPFIETNIRRVFLHRFFGDREGVHDREILPLVEWTMDRDDPRSWFYALMDYGVHLRKTVPNPNRRSAHYGRQPAFEGSNRQLRGAILRAVAEQGALPAQRLYRILPFPPDRIDENLSRLAAEGLLAAEEDGGFRLPG